MSKERDQVCLPRLPRRNWHSILRNGLKSMSGTAMQLNGAAHGSGIYFAPEAQQSLSAALFFSTFNVMALRVMIASRTRLVLDGHGGGQVIFACCLCFNRVEALRMWTSDG